MRLFHSLLPCLLFASALIGAETPAAPKEKEPSKKGWAGGHPDTAKEMNCGWFYNWGPHGESKDGVEFVPMIKGKKGATEKVLAQVKKSGAKVLLGFNEPDHPKQANMTPAEALEKWPALAAKAKTLVGPALAGNPLKSEWLAGFLKGDPRVDALAVHWYKGADSARFIKDLEELHARFKKPIWVTEYAPQTAADSSENPTKFTQAKVNAFVEETTAFMEKTPWVHRYAWHHSGAGTSALFTKDGQLTETGKAYAAAKK